MNCSNCQNPIQDGEKFCGKCGGENKKISLASWIVWNILFYLDVVSILIIGFMYLIGFWIKTIFNDSGREIRGLSEGAIVLLFFGGLCVFSYMAMRRRMTKIGIGLVLFGTLPFLNFIFFNNSSQYEWTIFGISAFLISLPGVLIQSKVYSKAKKS